MRRSKTGQAALEFLTTYGWAFLLIMVMIGAISYFGILNPSKFIPARCSGSPEFSCTDFQVRSNGEVNLVFKQSVGKTITFNSITCTYGGTPVVMATSDTWKPSETKTKTCNFGTAFAQMTGEKVKILYDITYQKSTGGLSQIATGEVFAEVQP